MQKLALFILAFIACISNVLANNILPQSQNPLIGSGFYLGLGAQHVSGDVDYDSTSVFELGLVGLETEGGDISTTGYTGMGLIGFGLPLPHQFYLGAEAQGVVSNQEGNLHVNSFFHDGPQILSFNARIKYLNNYGLLLRPGYYLTPNYLVFLRGGYINGSFEVAAVPGELNSNVPSLDDVTQKKRVGGYLLGAGIEMHLVQGLGARAEYDFMNYNSFNTNTVISFLIPGTSAEIVKAFTYNKFSPKAGAITLALTYSFGWCHNL